MTYYHYDEAAATYDGHFTRDVDGWEDARLTRLLGPVVHGAAVLDLGCGTGWVADHLYPAEYTGVDCSVAMLAELARKHPDARTVKAEVGGPGWAADLPTRHYQAVTATWSLEYLGELDALLTICLGLVAPGGTIALHGSLPRGHRRAHFSVKSAPYRPLSRRAVERAAATAGLRPPLMLGTGALPDSWAPAGRRAWDAALSWPPQAHYAALWTWWLP